MADDERSDDEPYGDLADDAYERAKDARLEWDAEQEAAGAPPGGVPATISGGPVP